MKTEKAYPVHYYSPLEEGLNVWTHLTGLILSVAALAVLVLRALELHSTLAVVGFTVFGLSMILLYLSSTLYHYSKNPKLRYRLNILDHASIYVLIAGSYTPFVLVTLHGTEGWIVFCTVWSVAVTGIILKIFFTGRFQILSTVLYVAMGWMIVFSMGSLLKKLDFTGLLWLIFGGISYTVGAILFSFDRLKMNHAIFHIFVLAGTFCHFMAVYFYVTPVIS